MTPTERAQAYHAALWQAQILLDDGNPAEAKRVIEATLHRPELRHASQRFNIATATGDKSVMRWQYRAEQASQNFIIHQRTPGAGGESGPFAVTHDPSGLAIAQYASRGEARNFVRDVENQRWYCWQARTAAELVERIKADVPAPGEWLELPNDVGAEFARRSTTRDRRPALAHMMESARLHPSPVSRSTARLVA